MGFRRRNIIMYRTRQQFPSFMGVYIPPCSNISSSVNVRICNIATIFTMESLPIANTYMFAFMACLRGISRRDGNDLNSIHLAFIFKKGTKLIKTPRVTSSSKCFVSSFGVHAESDIFKILDSDTLVFFLGLRNKPFANTVIHDGSESFLTSSQPFQQLMAVAGVFGLNRSSYLIIFVSYIFDLIGRNTGSIRDRNNICDSHINTNKILCILFFLIWDLYRLIEIEFTLDKDEVGFSFCELHKMRTIAGICYFLTPSNKRDGAYGFWNIVGENTTIVCNSPKFTETSLFLSIKLIRICDLADSAYDKLRGKAIRFLYWIVNLLVQTKLLKYTSLPRYLRNSVASLIENTKCIFQHFDLLACWKQLYLQCQFHTANILKISNCQIFEINLLIKEGIVVQSLPRDKDLRVSLNLFYEG